MTVPAAAATGGTLATTGGAKGGKGTNNAATGGATGAYFGSYLVVTAPLI